MLQGDICGPIDPPSETFRYYFVLVNASGSHLEVSLLPTRNVVFPKTLAILLKYKNHFLEFSIKHLRMDNAQEFRSHAFEDFCTASGINLTYSVPYEHAQNGLAEAFVKKIHSKTSTSSCQITIPGLGPCGTSCRGPTQAKTNLTECSNSLRVTNRETS
jgi:hypothetical protein